MRLIVLLILPLLLFPLQANTSVSTLAALSVSDDYVTIGENVTVCIFVNVTVLFNDTIAEYRNGTISVNMTMNIPEGLNYTGSSTGEYRNGTFVAYRDNTTTALAYVYLNATEEGNYTLSATIELNISITARSGNATPAYYNDTLTITTNFVKLHVLKPSEPEEWNRLGIYDALRLRYFQVLIVLLIAGFLIANVVADMRAKKRS